MIMESMREEELWAEAAALADELNERPSKERVPLIIVEDDEPTWRAYVEFIERQPDAELFEIAVATTAEQALWLWSQHRQPTVFLIDGHLPDHSGVRLCKVLRSLPGFKSVGFVSGDPSIHQPAVGEGASWFLEKGAFSPSVLMEHLRTARREVLEHMHESLDTLTGFTSVYQFKRALHGALARARRAGGCVSVLFIDADGLKRVNDRYGHAAGSRLIIHVGRCIQDCVRGSDVPVRIGGDEFAVLLPETDEPAAAEVAARIEERVRSHPFNFKGKTFSATVSVGCATVRAPEIGEDLEAVGARLVELADHNMYLHKRGKKQPSVLHRALRVLIRGTRRLLFGATVG
jgi:diguanylate cyclase (GGDEF)-like protein